MIGEIVRTARRSRGMTQEEVARACGYSVRAITDLEQGKGTVPLLEAVKSVLDLRLTGLPRGDRLSERLIAARSARGWSLVEAASRAGISKNAVMRLERGAGQIRTLEVLLAVLGRGAAIRAHKPETTAWQRGRRDERFTPADFLDRLIEIVGRIELDPCGHPESPVQARRFFYREDDGLTQPWIARVVYVNPPFSDQASWIEKAHLEWKAGNAALVIMLLRVRTNGRAFHEHLPDADVFFLRDRLRFGEAKTVLPFGTAVAVFGGDEAIGLGILSAFRCAHMPKPGERRLALDY